jgi:hypothetical protein
MNILKKPTRYLYLCLSFTSKPYLFRTAYEALETLNKIQKESYSKDDYIKLFVVISEECPELKLQRGQKILLTELLPTLPRNTKLVFHYNFYEDSRKKICCFRKSSISNQWTFARK